jgi:hypothetical protein
MILQTGDTFSSKEQCGSVDHENHKSFAVNQSKAILR